MSLELKYALPDEAHALLAKARIRCHMAVNYGVMSKERAMAAYMEVLRTIMRNHLQPVDDSTRMIEVECRFCQHKELVRANVVEFTCGCKPEQTQITFISRVQHGDPKLEGPLAVDLSKFVPMLPVMGRDT